MWCGSFGLADVLHIIGGTFGANLVWILGLIVMFKHVILLKKIMLYMKKKIIPADILFHIHP